MVSREIIEQALEKTMSGGADFAEIYIERTKTNFINMLGVRVEKIGDNELCGIGIRAYKGLRSVYASTCDVSRAGVMKCASQVAGCVNERTDAPLIRLTERIFPDVHAIKIVPSGADKRIKTEILRTAANAAKQYSDVISQVSSTLVDVDHTVWIANSDGLWCSDRQVRTRLAVVSVASRKGENQSGMCGPGARMGLELFDTTDPAAVGIEASRQAVVNLNADYCRAGKMTVAIENGFGGVIFHESCGHSLEATSVANGASQFCNKLGEKIAGDKVTAVDDGTIPNAWGSVNIDDEGHPSQRNVLIENGVLKSYLVDRFNARRMGTVPTGSARRQSYEYEPTSRMTNTYIAAGPDKNEDIIASIDFGLYAKSMGGGSVDPATGAFNFAVNEGYMIRGGKICEAVRGASLVGTGSEILRKIDMVGDDMQFGQGMCGSSSGSVPVCVGQPLIRVSELTVGGR
ncbi:MAG TPA: TldD/PmbA family protein [Bacillota bacterium]|nr:TldD/PmbA family protein [Bacillota bacterium]